MTAAQVMGLRINMQKTKHESNKKKPSIIKTLKKCYQKYERVKEFKYLGTILAEDYITTEIKERIIITAENSYCLKNQSNLPNFRLHIKCKLYKTLRKPTLIYVSECWPL
jgi:hypothetical protein